MLKSFEVYNFKSFTNKTSFSVEKEKDIEILEENTKNNLLKGLLFIGPNASGKTNSIHALNLLLEIIHKECNLNKYVNFFKKGRMYVSYTFEFDCKTVFYKIDYDSDTKLVDEILKVEDKIIFEFKEKETIALRSFFEDELKNPILIKCKNYLKNSVILDLFSGQQSEKEDDFKNPKVIYNSTLVKETNSFLDKHNFEFKLNEVENPCEKEDLYFIKDGYDIPIPFDMESIGNKTIMYLLPVMNRVLKTGGMILVDEFGGGMHNNLEELIIRYFLKNSKNSQIFIVSHSTNLISQNLLRPDQIICIDHENGSSIGFKFSAERPRSSQNLEKMYLGGVFGGLPNFNKK